MKMENLLKLTSGIVMGRPDDRRAVDSSASPNTTSDVDSGDTQLGHFNLVNA